MRDSAQVLEALGQSSINLDAITKALDAAVDELDAAEAEWDEKLDLVYADIEDETGKSPSEHVAVSVARREHRTVYRRYREARRQIDKLKEQRQARSSVLSGLQSELNGLKDEVAAQRYADRAPASHTYGARRAA